MRIIRRAAVLAIILVAIAPRVSLADSVPGTDSNEINTNLQTQNSPKDMSGIVLSAQNGQLALASAISADYAPIDNQRLEEPGSIALAKFEKSAGKNNSRGAEFLMDATAYTAASDECGKGDGITASGLVVRAGETIACPERFPFGTKVKINGWGTYVCEDRGGAIHGNRFDIYMESKGQAFQFGRRMLSAEVME